MSERDPSSESDPSSPREPIPVQPAGPLIPDYASSTPARNLVTIRSQMTLPEAELASAALAAEGIPTVILDRDLAVLNPLVFPAVKLQVYEVDVELAEQILSRPAPEDAEGEYVEEEWRCPKCHRRKVELVPASRARRLARMVCMIAWLLPFVGALITWLAVPGNYSEQVQEAVGWAVCPWSIIVLVLTTGLVVRRRLKRCTHCGHQW